MALISLAPDPNVNSCGCHLTSVPFPHCPGLCLLWPIFCVSFSSQTFPLSPLEPLIKARKLSKLLKVFPDIPVSLFQSSWGDTVQCPTFCNVDEHSHSSLLIPDYYFAIFDQKYLSLKLMPFRYIFFKKNYGFCLTLYFSKIGRVESSSADN